MAEIKMIRDAEDDILRFLAGTVLSTNSRSHVHGGGPLCTEEELQLLVQALKASREGRKLPPSDVDRLYGLFIRAGESRHIDLRDGGILCERLKGVGSPPSAGRPG